MNYLLDTHTFIWWALEPKKLSKRVLQLLEAPSNNVFLSIVSIWEMQIKMQLNKLNLPFPLADIVSQQQTINHIKLLTIEPSHIYALEHFPLYHRDPFDRLLIAQSSITKFAFISKDPEFSKYSIRCIW